MNIYVEELKKYCNEGNNSYGALLLTGSWGCGKTWFLDNVFCEIPECKKKFLFLKISLFGEDSIENIHRKLKTMYLKERTTDLTKNKSDKLLKITKFIKTIFKSNDYIQSVLNLDLLDFVDIENKINNKEVVLILDDLERCYLKINDIIGLINYYCSIRKIKIIVIANENYLKNKDEYLELKEKVFSRVINYRKDPTSFLNIINEYEETEQGYKDFLRNNLSIKFNDNLRLFKIAILKFEIIFNFLKNEISSEKIDILFYLFYYTVCENNNGRSFKQICESIRTKYPHLSDHYIIESVRYAIDGGYDEKVWNNAVNDFIIDLKEDEVIKPIYILGDERIAESQMEIKCFDFIFKHKEDELLKIFQYASIVKFNFIYNAYVNIYDYLYFLFNYSFARLAIKDIAELDIERLQNIIDSRINELIEHWEFEIFMDEYEPDDVDKEDDELYTQEDAKRRFFYENNYFGINEKLDISYCYDILHTIHSSSIDILNEIRELMLQIIDVNKLSIRYQLVNHYRYSEGNLVTCLYSFSNKLLEETIDKYRNIVLRENLINHFKEVWINNKCKVIDAKNTLKNFNYLKAVIEQSLKFEIENSLFIHQLFSSKFICYIESAIDLVKIPYFCGENYSIESTTIKNKLM